MDGTCVCWLLHLHQAYNKLICSVKDISTFLSVVCNWKSVQNRTCVGFCYNFLVVRSFSFLIHLHSDWIAFFFPRLCFSNFHFRSSSFLFIFRFTPIFVLVLYLFSLYSVWLLFSFWFHFCLCHYMLIVFHESVLYADKVEEDTIPIIFYSKYYTK